tara:strand:+ start:44 stop:205 length:162 start_codon:yes stop_codon:yes gene_type:complete
MKLGNLIEYITTRTGIKYLVDTYHSVRGTKCNCDKRKNALNKYKIDRNGITKV